MTYIDAMKQIATLLLVVALGAPAHAQEANKDLQKGMTLLQEGTRLLLEGLMGELGNISVEIQGRLIDLQAYEFPEILPNGDIIIRRKKPTDTQPPAEGEIEL
jgi:hypothetical protein